MRLLRLIKANNLWAPLLEQLGLSMSGTTFTGRKRSRSIQVLAKVALLLALSSAVFSLETMMGINYHQVQMIGDMVGYRGLGIFSACIIGFIFVLVYATMSAGSTLFSGKDMALLMTLPVTQGELFFSRLFLHYKANAPLYWLTVLPGMVSCGISYGISVSLIVSSIFLLVFGPVFPVMLSTLLSHLMLRLGKGKGKQSRKEFLAMVLLMVLILFAQGGASRWMRLSVQTSDLAAFAQSYGALIDTLQRILFYFTWQADMLVGRSVIVAFVGFILLTTLFCTLIGYIIGGGYHQSLYLAQLGGEVKPAKKQYVEKHLVITQRSVLWTLCCKEFSIITSSTAFMTELFAEAGIPLLLIFVYGITGTLGDISSAVGILSSMDSFVFMVCGVLLLMGCFSMMSSTSISREGTLFPLSQLIPVPAKEQVKAKLLAHMLLFYGPYAVYAISCLVFFNISFQHLIWMLPLGFLVILSSACLGLAIDYHRPVLDWKLPQQAIKQNMNGLMAMGGSFFLIMVLAAITYILLEILGVGDFIVGILLGIPAALGLLGLWKWVNTEAESRLLFGKRISD